MDQLNKKARQILQAPEVKDLYKKFSRTHEGGLDAERDQEDVSYLGSLLYMFGNSPELKAIQKENKAAINNILKTWKGRENEPGLVTDIVTVSSEHLNRLFNKALELKAAGLPVVVWPEGMKQEEAERYLAIANNQGYINFRDLQAKGGYIMEPGKWPEADISGGRVNGKAIMKPAKVSPVIKEPLLLEMQETMNKKVLDLAKQGDLAADVFDIITAKWLKEAKYHESAVIITADEILEARGLKKKLGGSGRRGGYKEEWRQQIAEQIDHLSHQWITIAEMEVVKIVKGKRKVVKWRGEGRALSMDIRLGQERLDGTLDTYAWKIRPGIFSEHLFGPGRQTALLSNKALEYDHYRQTWEKRLARYLAYLWRIDENRTREGLLVKTLLDKAGEEVNKRFPGRTRDRLEKALDQLQADGVITAWQYENIEEEKLKGQQWWRKWLELKILLTAPPAILQQYSQIERPKGNKR